MIRISAKDRPEDAPQHPVDVGLKALVQKIQLLAFDFDGVFTDNAVWVHEDGTESVRCWRSDGLGLRRLEQVGIEPVILSTETNAVVVARSRKLLVECVHGCEDKLTDLQAICGDRGLGLNQVAFVGNDINDLDCLEAVRLPMVVSDAHPDVIRAARYQTRAPGGHGAVREICDAFHRILTEDRGAA